MKKTTFFVILLVACLLISNSCLAEETKPRCLEGIEFLTGFSWGKLLSRNWKVVHESKRGYQLVPFLVDFDFNLKPLTKKLNFNPKQLLQFQIEPFISYISSPDANVEAGTSFLLKMGLLPQGSKFQPYIKAGLGLVYMTQHTQEQATQFNFTEQAGIGMHYFLRKNTAFTLEGRFRHLSNSGIDRPNHGINTYFALAGITYQF